HMAYLFTFTSHPEKTQYYINKIMNEQYHDQPDGLSGNEDCGQMSAWLVMSSMGFYPVSPGNNMYTIGTPWFKKMTINLENGKKILISAPTKTNFNYYIKGIALNGKPYKKLFLNFADIAGGANLNFALSASPGVNYLNSLQKPVMRIKENLIVPNPIIEGPQETFKNNAEITLSAALSGTDIYYTLDGSSPGEKASKYTKPFIINDGLTVKAIAYKNGYKTSYVSTATYQKITNTYTIKVNSEINKSFTAGGNDGLIDGVRGTLNWRVGNRWQGFWGKDFDAVLDLGKMQRVNTVSIGALQDTQAWIVFPPETEFYIAGEDANFRLIETIKSPVEAKDYTIQIKDLLAKIGTECRYIKIKAKNYGILPAWHEGVGGKAHTFFDEIIVN
ncbi:MAG: glycoside hydrolase family 92 protein, partial [Chitinophagaceae bacterium]